jgi:hypothetical protein
MLSGIFKIGNAAEIMIMILNNSIFAQKDYEESFKE